MASNDKNSGTTSFSEGANITVNNKGKGSTAVNSAGNNQSSNNTNSTNNTPNRAVLTKRTSAINTSTTSSATIATRSKSIRGTKGNNSNLNSSGTLFNPWLIFSQIAALQFFHYFVLATFLQINKALFGSTVTLDRIFTPNYLNLWNKSGWVDNGTILLSFVVGAVLLALIVEKAKKCLDFAVTLCIIHLMICVTYIGHLPFSWDWWILHIFGTIVMIVLGEFLCSRRELMDIPLLVISQ